MLQTTPIDLGKQGREPLRYYMHDGSTAFRFELAGSFSGKGAWDVEQAWRTASSVIEGLDLIIDLSYVTHIDEAGHELLGKWHAQGARFVAISAETGARVQALMDHPVVVTSPKRETSTWLPFRTTALCPAAFCLLFPPAAANAPTTKEGSRHDVWSARNYTPDGVMRPVDRSANVLNREIRSSGLEGGNHEFFARDRT